MRAVGPDTGIETVMVNRVPAFHSGASSGAVSLALKLMGQNATHAVSYGTEAGLFQRAGLSTVVCGPGSIQQAHQADEYVELSQLASGEAFLRGLGR